MGVAMRAAEQGARLRGCDRRAAQAADAINDVLAIQDTEAA